jgi:hypothetical protein
MSFSSRSIRSEPMPGVGISPTVPSVRPIGLFLGSAGVHRADIQGMVTVSAFRSDAAAFRSCAKNFRCPQMAPLRHADRHRERPLIREDRKWAGR